MKNIKFAAILLLVAVIAGCGGSDQANTNGDKITGENAFETTVTIKIVDGSKVFRPAEIEVEGNKGTLNVENELDAPHGFKIAELGIQEVVEPNSTMTLNIDRIGKGDYTIDCQLHSAHKHGKLTVKAP